MNVKADDCPASQILAKFAIGNLDLPSAETISQHLETCIECRAAVASAPPDSFINLVLEAHGYSASASSSEFVSSGSAPLSLDIVPPTSLTESGDYEIIRALGHGGMGVVYLARNLVLDRLEALKVVSKSLLDRPGARERFQREMRSAARLNHPNIVAAYSAPRVGELLVLAMEYVDGQNLAQIVAESGPLPIEQATYYAHQVALGLQHAHERGMVHRDIKPGNLMLARVDQKSVVKILDFGLAKATSEAARPEGGLTMSGQILGTPAYIAPEQTLDAARADIRADIYSLGCTLYYLLAGRPPFEAESLYEVMHAHHHIEARRLDQLRPDVPAGLAAVVAKMMAKDPAARHQSPAEVAQALVPYFDTDARTRPGATSKVVSGGEVLRLSKLSRPAMTALFATFVLVAAALAIVPFRSKTDAGNGDALVNAAQPTILVPDRGSQPPSSSPPPAIAPFDATQARAHQEAWATHLGVSVEQTNSIGMKLVMIPPGEFMMGSSQEEIEGVATAISTENPGVSYALSMKRTRTEVPKHRVAIRRPFLLAATELTVGQFRKFVEATRFVTDAERGKGGSRPDYEGNGGWIDHDPATTWRHPWCPTTDEFPVSVVSWNDAVQFCNWLSIEEHLKPRYQSDTKDRWMLIPTGDGYRLPTEAQWEFACRAGTTTQFSFGEDPTQLQRYGWYWPVIAKTAAPVAKKLPNPFGLYDMHGNVSEFCHDGYSESYYDVSPPIDPQGPAGLVDRRTQHGGDWNSSWDMARSSFRRAVRAKGETFFTLGFRVARELATGSNGK